MAGKPYRLVGYVTQSPYGGYLVSLMAGHAAEALGCDEDEFDAESLYQAAGSLERAREAARDIACSIGFTETRLAVDAMRWEVRAR